MISGTIIVVRADLQTYYFATDQVNKILRVSNKIYCGCGRSWDYWLPDSVPENIKKLTKEAEDSYSQNLMYRLFQTREKAKLVLDWLNENDDDFSYETIEVYSVKKADEITVKEDGFIGIDIDCNGHYPIKEELFASKIDNSIQVEFEEFFTLLNRNGLFNSAEDAKNFIDCYLRIQSHRNIEKVSEDEILYSFIYKPNSN
ncbi:MULTISPECIES: hypothetical protein [Shewanella]|uniref:Uncharacterized protein n=1 Tax=Shewanella indica TaxID=768528 RepID=A0ABU4QE61_9GAMM|nr:MULTISPECIES: hypothetical protein [Shewanella]OIN08761.1 hypothetical protein BFS86_16630 [Shewanella algae]MCE9793832.1 hypothetical protein [Shewanella indica]MDX6016579.1 hypothetical protein [Shewanella indica]NDO76604.1 hypothetical protein [Shewanella sp. SE1]TVP08496.1 hypothetical protein AYI96_20075 [Shewanella sp. MSW]